jgi:hypothetical protein
MLGSSCGELRETNLFSAAGKSLGTITQHELPREALPSPLATGLIVIASILLRIATK